ncbi:hypothetical protein PVAND_000040 [Polypedilum vanderplanki]|uniref:PH domain-containing protein n=1 Tax=Polypedilum vanderplanki TaxID=319348 RepID=A0A9J6BJ51_POLVA|nr:hypothetical protein PVAND_000040 [Polypedilum vanderplanki]
MKINEKTLYAFGLSRTCIDLEGYLNKRGEVNKAFQKRWFVLKGNLLFYYEKKEKREEPLGVIILEGCRVELADYEEEKFCFTINFPQNRCYILSADSQEQMELWMKALTTAGYDYMRLMIGELQRQLTELDAANKNDEGGEQSNEVAMKPPKRRQNPFDKMRNNYGEGSSQTNMQSIATISGNKFVELRQAPPPPVNLAINRDTVRDPIIRDDNELLLRFDDIEKVEEKETFNFLTIHEYFGKSWKELIKLKLEEKELAEKPLIVF